MTGRPYSGISYGVITLSLAVLMTVSCAEVTSPSARGAVLIVVDAGASKAIAGLTVNVSGPGIESPLYANLSDQGSGLWTTTLEVPVGPDRVFVVEAFEPAGMVTHRGEATMDVGETNDALPILVSRLTGEVPVSGTIGSYALTISPATADLAVGATLRFGADIVDQDGVPVADAVAWAIRNPAVATLSIVGDSVDVTGQLSGQGTELVATYKGYVARASIAVN